MSANTDDARTLLAAAMPGMTGTALHRALDELDRLREEQRAWQRATGCIDPFTISDALARIGALAERTPTEGIPDAIERIKRERDAALRARGPK